MGAHNCTVGAVSLSGQQQTLRMLYGFLKFSEHMSLEKKFTSLLYFY